MTTKIRLDKYYTPPQLAKYVVDKTKEIIGENNITEYIEPSAGAGVFLQYLDKPYSAYDIDPEHSEVIKQDYLQLELMYKQGRCIIGNPPFGNANNLARSFYNKATQEGDYISFILPISQLNNTDSLYRFDLIHSEDLGVQKYSGRKVNCCLNIYQIPSNGTLNKRPNYRLEDVSIYRDDQKGYMDIAEDLCIFRRGTVGKVKEINKDKQAYKIVINNKIYKDKVIDVILGYDWENYKTHQSAPSVSKNDIWRVLKEQIPELE